MPRRWDSIGWSSVPRARWLVHGAFWAVVGCGALTDPEKDLTFDPAKVESADGGVESDVAESVEVGLVDAASGAVAPRLPCLFTFSGDVPLLDDLDDGNIDSPYGFWFAYGDDAGEQIPAAIGWTPTPGGRPPEGSELRSRGGGYETYGAGQGIVFAAGGTPCYLDGSPYEGIAFEARGTITLERALATQAVANRLQVRLGEPATTRAHEGGQCVGGDACSNQHQLALALHPERWTRYFCPFTAFLQSRIWGVQSGDLDVDAIANATFAVAQGHEFDYEVDNLRLYRGEEAWPDNVVGSCERLIAGCRACPLE